MAAYPERCYTGERCYSRLACTWGEGALNQLGISKRSICNALWKLRHGGNRQDGSSSSSGNLAFAGSCSL